LNYTPALASDFSFSKEEVTAQETTTDNSVLFAYQLSTIGIILGTKFFFEAEVGFDYAGVALSGPAIGLTKTSKYKH
jgi:hypothetical protein